jgi:hypothetical protein
MLSRGSVIIQVLVKGCAPRPVQLLGHSLVFLPPAFERRSVPMKGESGIVAIDFAHERFCIVPVRRQNFESEGSRFVSQANHCRAGRRAAALVAGPKERSKMAWRQSIRVGKDHVEADRSGTLALDLFCQLGQKGPRPWPLPKLLEAFVVNINNGNGIVPNESWMRPLEKIETEVSRNCKRGRVPNAQQLKYGDRDQSRGPERK